MSAPRALADIESVRLVVGLEVHVELATRTKVFAAVGNPAHPEFDGAPPNTLIDPVVLGLPGALPVLSHAAVEVAVRVGLALNCRIAEQSKWDRKSYFYPDLPKGYQISQYQHPLARNGRLTIYTSQGEQVVRIFTHKGDEMSHAMRELGYRVTQFEGKGRDGPIQLLFIHVPRRRAPKLRPVARKVDENCFIVVDDVRSSSNAVQQMVRK